MIRIVASLVVFIAAAGVLVGSQAGAQTAPMTDEHIQRIKDNCQAAERTLAQIKISDTQLRVNRVQLYIWISTKLMASMNGRLALNKLDGSKLVSITADHDRTKNMLVARFMQYDDQLAATIRIDCQAHPVEFYESVRKARELRQQVHQATQTMTQHIQDYGREFDVFKANFKTTRSGSNS